MPSLPGACFLTRVLKAAEQIAKKIRKKLKSYFNTLLWRSSLYKKNQSYLELCSGELLSKASNHLASEAATSELDPFEYLEDCFCRLLAPSYWHLVRAETDPIDSIHQFSINWNDPIDSICTVLAQLRSEWPSNLSVETPGKKRGSP